MAALSDPITFLKAAGNILKKNTKGTILLDLKGDIEVGLSIELIESKSEKWLFDGWSVDAYGDKKNFGIGVAKDIYSNKFIEIDTGLYIKKEFNELLNMNIKPDVCLGLSGTWKF